MVIYRQGDVTLVKIGNGRRQKGTYVGIALGYDNSIHGDHMKILKERDPVESKPTMVDVPEGAEMVYYGGKHKLASFDVEPGIYAVKYAEDYEVGRSEHLDWCKKRAMECVDHGDLNNAFASMLSDLRKHQETEDHPAIELGLMLKMGGHLSTSEKMREFIDGFN